MKTVSIIMGVSFLIITAILISLVKKGTVLKPAGVIKPHEITADSELIGKSIAMRLFPDFQEAKNVIWYVDVQEEVFSKIPQVAHSNYQNPQKPELKDLRANPEDTCQEKCWYIQQSGKALPDQLQQKLKTEPTVEVYIQYFDRNVQVPETCETQKILDANCITPVSVRDVRRKIKTEPRHFFMQRYLDSKFFLFIENPPSQNEIANPT